MFRKKVSDHLEMNQVKNVKSNKKGFYWYIISSRKTRENVGPPLNSAEGLMTKNMEKDTVHDTFEY